MTADPDSPVVESAGGEDESTQELWKLAFQWIGESSDLGIPHPLDLDRAKSVMTDLSAVGERPDYSEVKRYLAEIWPSWPGTQRQIRELWRRLERNPGHRFRMRKPRLPFYTLDRLVEAHDLQSLDERLHSLANKAIANCVMALNQGSADEFAFHKAECERVLRALEDLRALRYGPASVGRWWDDFESPKPPPGTRGTLV